MSSSLAGVLYKMCLVKNDARPIYGMEAIRMFAEDIVVDDDPTWIFDLDGVYPEYLYRGIAIDY